MKTDLNKMTNLKAGLEVFKSDIIEKINNLSKEKLEEILNNIELIEQEISDLKYI